VLEDGDVIMTESAVVAEFVDRKYAASPDARLLSDDPVERAEAQLFITKYSGKVMGGFFKLMGSAPGDERTAAAA
jgi:glutathione S-transferase